MAGAQTTNIHGTAHFSGANKVIVGSGLSMPEGIAVDGNGNVYVADYGGGRLVEEKLSSGSYTQSALTASSGTSPYGVAIDGSFNIYVADPFYGVTKCVPQAGGGCTQSKIGQGLHTPFWVAVDASGNVYISDEGLGAVLKETLQSDGSFVQTQIYASTSCAGVAVDASGNVYIADLGLGEVLKESPKSGGGYAQTVVASGLGYPVGVAVDRGGNVYVADNSENEVLKETPQSGSNYTQTVVASGLNTPIGVAVDASNNIYVVDGLNHQVVELLPGGADFGAVNVGSTSPVISLHFTVDAVDQTSWDLQLKSRQVRTQGTTGLDFADTGTGTCNPSTLFHIGDGCTVNLTFTPQLPGARNGSAALTNAAGEEIATGYVKGTGVGPQVNFASPPQALLFSSLKTPAGIAADGSGNLYVADTGNNRVLMATLSGSYAPTTVTSGTLSSPADVAVDGNGNLYIADTGNSRILKETLQYDGSWAETTVGSGLLAPSGVAVDGGGNVYIADTGNNRVLKEMLTLGKYSQSVIGSSLTHPVGVAADGAGNVYVLDGGTIAAGDNPGVYEETLLAGGGYSQSLVATSALTNPQAIAVDSMGNLYITDLGSPNRVLKESLASGSFTESVLPFTGLTTPWGVAADGSGNVYAVDSSTATVGVYKLKTTVAPTLNFSHSTDMGATDTTDGAQTATIVNIGNAALTFPIPSTGNDPSISANFSLNSSDATACTVVTSSSFSAATLAAGSSCTLAVNFHPTTYGTISGSLLLTDDNLNATATSYATQSISLTGTGVAPTQLLFSAPSPMTLGDSSQLTAQGVYADGQTLDISSLLTWVSSNTSVANFVTSGTPSLVTALAPGTTNITVSLGVNATPTPVTQLLTVNPISAPRLSLSFTPDLIPLNGTATTTLTMTIANPNARALTGLAFSNSYPTALVADSTPLSTCGSLSSTTSGFSVSSGMLAAGASCTVSVTMHGTTSGIYTDTTGTATSNEALVGAATSAQVQVGTVSPTLSLNCPTVAYDGNPHSCTGVATGIGGAAVAGSWSYTPASETNVSSTSVTGTFTSSSPNYTNGTATGTLTISTAEPTITWPAPAAIPYGTALSATQLNATATSNGATVAGRFVYTPAAGTVLNAGANQTLSATFTPTDTVSYTATNASVLLTVNSATQSIKFTNSNVGYSTGVPSGPNSITMTATYGVPPLTLSALGGASGNPVTFALVSGPATLSGTTLSIVGAGTVKVTANQAGNGNYSAAPQATETILVGKATPAVSLATNTPARFLLNPIQLTATVASSVSTPIGTATFYDGSVPIGTATLNGSAAALSTSALAAGSHNLTVTYSGDGNFLAPTSSAITVYVEDFTINYTGSNSATVMPGSSTQFNFTVAPPSGTTFPAAIALTISGLPTGSTYNFSSATLASGAGSTPVALTIQLPLTMVSQQSNDKVGRRLAPLALALLLLPFAGRLRRSGRILARALALLLLLAAGLAATAGLSGCGSPSLFYAQGGGSYEVTVTAASGALSHSAIAILNVE